MNHIPDDFAARCAAVFAEIGPGQTAALATRDGDGVSVRTMSVLQHEQKFYFQTDGQSGKAVLLQRCPQAALAFGAFQVRGRCVLLGHPLEEHNRALHARFAARFPDAARKYSHLPQEVLFCLVPHTVRIWRYTGDGAVLEELDLDGRHFTRRPLGY